MIEWKPLDSIEGLDTILEDSNSKPQVIFKHSTTCPISSMAKRRVEGQWDLDIVAHYLDLLAHRDISNAIADQLGIIHESPQIILVSHGKAIYDASHLDISVDGLRSHLEKQNNG